MMYMMDSSITIFLYILALLTILVTQKKNISSADYAFLVFQFTEHSLLKRRPQFDSQLNSESWDFCCKNSAYIYSKIEKQQSSDNNEAR